MSTTTNYSISRPQSTGQDTSPQGIRQGGLAKTQLQSDLLLAAKGGGKRKYKNRKYYTKGGAIEVNTIQPVYSDTAGGNQSAVNQQVGNQALFARATEQASLDAKASSVSVPASQKGGSTTILKAGQPWASCYSGGKKSKSKKANNSKKSRKSKKSKKARKTKKSRKSKK